MDFPSLFMGAESIHNLCLLPAGKMEEESPLTLKRGDGSVKKAINFPYLFPGAERIGLA